MADSDKSLKILLELGVIGQADVKAAQDLLSETTAEAATEAERYQKKLEEMAVAQEMSRRESEKNIPVVDAERKAFEERREAVLASKRATSETADETKKLGEEASEASDSIISASGALNLLNTVATAAGVPLGNMRRMLSLIKANLVLGGTAIAGTLIFTYLKKELDETNAKLDEMAEKLSGPISDRLAAQAEAAKRASDSLIEYRESLKHAGVAIDEIGGQIAREKELFAAAGGTGGDLAFLLEEQSRRGGAQGGLKDAAALAQIRARKADADLTAKEADRKRAEDQKKDAESLLRAAEKATEEFGPMPGDMLGEFGENVNASLQAEKRALDADVTRLQGLVDKEAALISQLTRDGGLIEVARAAKAAADAAKNAAQAALTANVTRQNQLPTEINHAQNLRRAGLFKNFGDFSTEFGLVNKFRSGGELSADEQSLLTSEASLMTGGQVNIQGAVASFERASKNAEMQRTYTERLITALMKFDDKYTGDLSGLETRIKSLEQKASK